MRSKQLGVSRKFHFAETSFWANGISNNYKILLYCLVNITIGYLVANHVWADKFDDLNGRHACC